MSCSNRCCFQWFKDTNLKANHNSSSPNDFRFLAVSNGSKILIWKQITTRKSIRSTLKSCFQWFKDTNLKANHNTISEARRAAEAVSNGSKILIWKQITTAKSQRSRLEGCFQWFKDTNLKANHNVIYLTRPCSLAVSNGSKILIWKQITTFLIFLYFCVRLFPMVQRY